MPAPRPLDGDVRAATVAAATRLFGAHGFEGTALQDIADAVGVTKPAVLHHYPSKEHIRQAVLDAILEHWNLTLPRLLRAASASHDRFQAIFGELVRFFEEDPDRARILVRETLDRPDEFRKTLRRVVRPWLTTVAQYIHVGRDAGRHHADIDGEAYVMHMIQLVVVATACGQVTSTLVDGDDAGAGRYGRELSRIARSSLFSMQAAALQRMPRVPRKRKHA
jgi:AcrR family transcriptional regulator